MTSAPEISIVTTAYNEEDNIPLLLSELTSVLKNCANTFEIIVVDNGSTDATWSVLQKQKMFYPDFLKTLKLTRNFGHQGGLLSGISKAQGQAVVTIDADLQHPPGVIAQMITKWREGFLIVNSEKNQHSATLLRKCADRIFYFLMDHYGGLKLGEADFRLLDRKVVNQILSFHESEKFLRGLISWTGFKTTTIKYNVNARIHGKSKFSVKHLVDFAIHGITSFSIAPLRLLFKLGGLVFIPSSLYLMYYTILAVLSISGAINVSMPPGWATIVITITFFGSIQLLSIGILGEYIGKVYQEIKRRPNFLIEEWLE